MRLPLIAAALLVASGTVAGQSTEDPGGLRAAYLEEGLPPALDVLRTQGFTNFRTATLVDDTTTVYAGLADWSGKADDVGWVIVIPTGGSIGAAFGFEMGPRERGTVGAEVEVSYDEGRRTLPLHLRLVPEAGILLWRSPGAPGGGALALRSTEQAVQVGELMPDLAFRTLDGAEASLSDLRGKTVVLNWWNTTCSPCIAEMPSLNGVVERYADRDDVVFLAVTYDEPQAVDRLLARRPFVYRQAFVGEDEGTAVFGEGYPVHVVVAPDGRVAFRLLGGSEDIGTMVERALARVGAP